MSYQHREMHRKRKIITSDHDDIENSLKELNKDLQYLSIQRRDIDYMYFNIEYSLITSFYELQMKYNKTEYFRQKLLNLLPRFRKSTVYYSHHYLYQMYINRLETYMKHYENHKILLKDLLDSCEERLIEVNQIKLPDINSLNLNGQDDQTSDDEYDSDDEIVIIVGNKKQRVS